MSDEIILDEASCKKAGSLAAHGFGDEEICIILIITAEQLGVAKSSLAYQTQLRDKLLEKAEAAIDLSEGWDTLEANSVAKVIDVMDKTFDPDYALRVAAVANRANRRTGSRTARTIDPSKVGQVIHLTFNQKFINKQSGREDDRIPSKSEHPSLVTIEQKPLMKRVSLPTPQQVTDLLAPARPLIAKIKEDKANAIMDRLGFGSFEDKNNT